MSSDERTLTAAQWGARCLGLEAVVEELRLTVAHQNRQIQDLQRKLERLGKNSSNSSKPPSSDIVKPKNSNQAGEGKRSCGAQPGHPMHDRVPFAPAQIQAIEVLPHQFRQAVADIAGVAVQPTGRPGRW